MTRGSTDDAGGGVPPEGRSGAARAGGALVLAQAWDGLASYGFLTLVGRQLGPDRFAPLSVMWSLLFVLGSGVFGPFEQELARRVGERRGRGEGVGAVIAGAPRVAVRVAVPLVLFAAVGGLLSAPWLFNGEWSVPLAMSVGVAGFAASHVVRGLLTGTGRLDGYAAWFLTDGVMTILPAGVCIALAVVAPWPYALGLGAATVFAAAVAATRIPRSLPPGPPLDGRDLLGAAGRLVPASLLLAVLINGGSVAVAALAGPGEARVVSLFLTGMVLARIPQFFFQTALSVLIAQWGRAVGADDRAGFVGLYVRVLCAVAGGGVLVVAVAGALGPQVLVWLFGPAYTGLGGVDLALLATAAIVLMVAMTNAAALVALQRQARVWIGWAAGVVAMLAGIAVPLGLTRRVEVGMVAGAAVASLVLGAMVMVALRDRWADRTVGRAVS